MDRLGFVLFVILSIVLSAQPNSIALAANPFKSFFKPFAKKTAEEAEPQKPPTPLHGSTESAQPVKPPSRYTIERPPAQSADWQLPVQGNAQQRSSRVRPAGGQTSHPASQRNPAPQTRVANRIPPAQTGQTDVVPQEVPEATASLEPAAVPTEQPQLAAPAADQIEWFTDLYEAHQVSIQTGRPMMIVFGAEWCHYCKQLESQTLSQPQMIAYVNQHFVPVHLDMDKDRDKEVARILEVKPLPCTVVLSPQADLLGKILGYYDVPSFRMHLEEARGTQFRNANRGLRSIRRR